MEIPESCQTVKAWYRAEVKKLGWSIFSEESSLELSSLSLTNPTEGGTVSFLLEEGICRMTFSSIQLSEVKNMGVPFVIPPEIP